MTCIVAINHESGSVMGCDSYMTDSNRFLTVAKATPKVMNVNKYIAIGTSGTVRFMNVCQSLERPLWDHFEDMAPHVVIQEFTKRIAKRIIETIPSIDDRGYALIVIGREFYSVDKGMGIIHFGHDCATLGSGEEAASGALFGLAMCGQMRERDKEKCRSLIETALVAAGSIVPTVRDPWVFIETETKGGMHQ